MRGRGTLLIRTSARGPLQIATIILAVILGCSLAIFGGCGIRTASSAASPNTVLRSIPQGAVFKMTMQAPRAVFYGSALHMLIDFYVQCTYGSQMWDCIWIGELANNLNWSGTGLCYAKVASIAQRPPEGMHGSFHLAHNWTYSKVRIINLLYNWSSSPAPVSLQKYPSLVSALWPRMPIVTTVGGADSELVSIDTR